MRAELETLALDLAAAWTSGRPIPDPEGAARPRDRQEAYQVQDRMAQAIGGKVGGWKVGAALRAVQVAEGHDGPIPGRLFADRIFVNEARLPASLYAGYKAELEYAFRLRRDLSARAEPYSRDEVAAAADFVPGIEIAGSRFQGNTTDRRTVLAIADNGSGGAFVFGENLADWRGIDLDGLAIEAGLPGQPVEFYRDEQRGDVVTVLQEMVNDLLARGVPLSAGDYLSTGSLCVPLPLKQGQPFIARFGGIATLRVTLV